MEQNQDTNTSAITPENVSPTAEWGKPKFKKKLAIKRRLSLNRDACPPTVQPKLNRIRTNEVELLDAIESLNACVGTTRRLHAQIFNGLNK